MALTDIFTILSKQMLRTISVLTLGAVPSLLTDAVSSLEITSATIRTVAGLLTIHAICTDWTLVFATNSFITKFTENYRSINSV